ncbi:hypothetical protein HCA69_12305 [Listeria grandensis]|uniref:Uncharacterized protein n=1 Tax=Listeria grandensis TaxID=1494963 RepID=A0A7X0Y588_9LIST|nr:hypothetical protein [Listeria grandensis]MBC1937154.1 hypothetical protein [Listeria grandensis]
MADTWLVLAPHALVKESEKAVLLEFEGIFSHAFQFGRRVSSMAWVPKSLIRRAADANGEILCLIPEWFARSNCIMDLTRGAIPESEFNYSVGVTQYG